MEIQEARSMHATDLAKSSSSVAQHQLSLREAGGALVRGALAAAGERHTGTGGWHIIPYVTPDGVVAYVDTAHGRAYVTSVRLDAETIEALTMPDQTPGAKASGAAVWSYPDAGGGASEAPDGWMQLLVDIRLHSPVADVVSAAPELVAYGLVTCYSHRRGDPIDKHVSDWPLDEEQRRRVRQIAEEWLLSARERVGPDPGYPSHPIQSGRGMVSQALFVSDVIRKATCEYGLGWAADAAGANDVGAVSGARSIDAIHRALKGRLVELLTPVADALPAGLKYGDGSDYEGGYAAIGSAASALLQRTLAPLQREITRLDARLISVLYEHGAIVTEAGQELGVTCSTPPRKPQAQREQIKGREVWLVPFGADVPDGFDHCLVMSVSHEIRCRPEDAEFLR